MLAGTPQHLTVSRFTNFHLGHLVTREWEQIFNNKEVWGEAEGRRVGKTLYEVIQVIKSKVRDSSHTSHNTLLNHSERIPVDRCAG